MRKLNKAFHLFIAVLMCTLLAGVSAYGETRVRAEFSKTGVRHYYKGDEKTVYKYYLSLSDDSICVSYHYGEGEWLNEVSRYTAALTLSQKNKIKKYLSPFKHKFRHSASFMVDSVWAGSIMVNPDRKKQRKLKADKAWRLYENIIEQIPMRPKLYNWENSNDIIPGFDWIAGSEYYKYSKDTIIEIQSLVYSDDWKVSGSTTVRNDSIEFKSSKKTTRKKLLPLQRDYIYNILSRINPNSEFRRVTKRDTSLKIFFDTPPTASRINVGDKQIFLNTDYFNAPYFFQFPYAKLMGYLLFLSTPAEDCKTVRAEDALGIMIQVLKDQVDSLPLHTDLYFLRQQ